MQKNEISHLDLRLIHAVQISPRASWSALAPIVGADPATLARRWSRLIDEGTVYLTAYGLGETKVVALVELKCRPGTALSVANALSGDSEAISIDLITGGRDILVVIAATDIPSVGAWTLERLQGVKGVRSVKTHIVSRVVGDARNWRLRELSPDEAARVEAADRPAQVAAVRLRPEEQRELAAALFRDGRAGTMELADQIGMAPRRVREAITAALATGRLSIRVDVARLFTPWPIYTWYFLRVPAAMVARVGPQLTRIEEVRLVGTTIGKYNVVMAVWLRDVGDVGRLEALIEERLPGVTIADRSIVLRSVKHLGNLLDSEGRATGQKVEMP
ncbi:Lrp/AsnC family transcriptional regulator [Paenarthrobacter sp. NPDC058040]|uniref:Lrp/AsnC family transcriptional regulator n=1 Tax=unclassified Paenarthrobacter TaxID=2634190 RepID=UPI0036D96507